MRFAERDPKAPTPAFGNRVQERMELALRLAERARAGAIAMQEETLDMRLRLWLDRLGEHHASRGTALELGLDAALAVASADCANIQLVHGSGNGLELVAHRGFEAPFLDHFAFVDDRSTACGLALLDHCSVAIADVATSRVFAETPGFEVMLASGVRAVRSTPLLGDNGHVLGVVSVHYRTPRAHSDPDIARLERVARAIARRIEREPKHSS